MEVGSDKVDWLVIRRVCGGRHAYTAEPTAHAAVGARRANLWSCFESGSDSRKVGEAGEAGEAEVAQKCFRIQS